MSVANMKEPPKFLALDGPASTGASLGLLSSLVLRIEQHGGGIHIRSNPRQRWLLRRALNRQGQSMSRTTGPRGIRGVDAADTQSVRFRDQCVQLGSSVHPVNGDHR